MTCAGICAGPKRTPPVTARRRTGRAAAACGIARGTHRSGSGTPRWSAALGSGSAGRMALGASPGCALSGWNPCPRPSRRMAPRAGAGVGTVRMRRALEQARQRLNRPAKTGFPWRIGLLDCGERLRELAGRRWAAATRWRRFPGCAPIGRTLAALQRELAGLGPDWTAGRVQRLERPCRWCVMH